MSKRSSVQNRVKKHELTQRMKALAAAALAQKIGYLRVDDLPEARIFERLPTQSFNAHRIIRGTDELFLLRHGLVEIWHTRHDFMVKELTIGMLFGEMPLLGQTMLGTRAITGMAGATVAVMDVDTVKAWLEVAPIPIVEKIGRRLADAETEHYRSSFQSSDSRIAALLVDLAREGSTILGVTHEDIAERLGVYRETVTIILDSLRSQRLIDIGRKRISIVNKRALRELSEL